MSSQALHTSLLRPAVIHILRAAGFHATKPSLVDTLTDICARYLLLIASRTAAFAYDRSMTQLQDVDEDTETEDWDRRDTQLAPNIADARNGLTSAAFFAHGLSASEEAWKEVMRKPLAAYSIGAREKERRRRDLEDTRDVREFIEWVTGPAAKEIRRIAGLLPDEKQIAPMPAPAAALASLPAPQGPQPRDDYLDVLKKKQSKSGDSARYNGTVLGKHLEEHKLMRIEGGPASIGEWKISLKRKRAQVEE